MKQSIARHSFTRGAAQARNLLANTSLSSAVTSATIELNINKPVQAARAIETCKLGALVLIAGERFYFVASKFTGRYYILVERDGAWECSSNDDRVVAALVAKIQIHQMKKAS